MSAKLSPCDPRMMDFVTWSVVRGVRMFSRVHVTNNGLIATSSIPQFDFAVVVPQKATLSVMSVLEDQNFPLRVSPSSFGAELEWWPDLNWGSLCFIAYLTQSWILGSHKGVQAYLDILPLDPAMPLGRVAVAAQRTEEYKRAVKPVVGICGVSEDDFDTAFRHAYCLFRRHAIPFWSSSTNSGHPAFSQCELTAKGEGDILGMTPVLDLTRHSFNPTAAVGFPDDEMKAWLGQERGLDVGPNDNYFVLQTLKDVEEGEPLTVNKNAFFNFDEETFVKWFNFPLKGM